MKEKQDRQIAAVIAAAIAAAEAEERKQRREQRSVYVVRSVKRKWRLR